SQISLYGLLSLVEVSHVVAAERQRERERETHTHTHTHKFVEMVLSLRERARDTQICRKRERETHTHTHTQICRNGVIAERESERHTNLSKWCYRSCLLPSLCARPFFMTAK
ncbi:unnamed protein product, partial [Musa hybrid cultivar]